MLAQPQLSTLLSQSARFSPQQQQQIQSRMTNSQQGITNAQQALLGHGGRLRENQNYTLCKSPMFPLRSYDNHR